MALYFYFNEATGDLVYSDQASYAGEGYTALGEQTNMNPIQDSNWVFDSKRAGIKSVAKDPAVAGKIAGLTSINVMFHNCSGLTDIDLSGLDTSQVTMMTNMFNGCSSLASIDLSGFDTSKAAELGSMFKNCSGLSSLDLSGFDTSQATYMYDMFNGCSGLTSLDVSGFDTSKVMNTINMFYGTSLLARIHIGPGYTIDVPNPGSSVAGRDGNWHAIGGASYAPGSVPRVDAVYYAAADLVPDGSLLVNLENLKAALTNHGGLPLSEDTVIAESGGKPAWVYAANAIDDGVPGFISRIAQGESWIEATFGCTGLRIEESMHSDAGQRNTSISMEMSNNGPVIKFGDKGLRGVLAYQNGMPVLTAMGESGPIMAGDNPYGFATYATDEDFESYVFQAE